MIPVYKRTSVDPDVLAVAGARWGLQPAEIEPIHTGEYRHTGTHFVYRVGYDGRPAMLRITVPGLRSPLENQAECDFLSHLNREGVAVALPLPSHRDREVEPIEAADGLWSASLFTEAPGRLIGATDAAYTATFVEEWGATLGRMHRAASIFRPVAGWERGDWDEAYWLRHALLLLPPDDRRAHMEFDLVTAALRDLPQTQTTYGMTHGNFGPQHVRYDPEHGMTALDFADCGFHWYVWDIAVAMSQALRQSDDQKAWFRRHFLAGYAREFAPGLELIEQLDWFLRLRMLELYLSRLWWFGPKPTPEEQAVLTRLRADVHRPVSWAAVAV